MKEMKIKTWFIDKEEDKARRYNIYLDYSRRDEELGQPIEEDGCYYMAIEEVLNETEKAVQVVIASGEVLGSYKGWKTWIPKSQIM